MRSIAYSLASYAAFRWGEDTAITTAASPISSTPIRCVIAAEAPSHFLRFQRRFEQAFARPSVHMPHIQAEPFFSVCPFPNRTNKCCNGSRFPFLHFLMMFSVLMGVFVISNRSIMQIPPSAVKAQNPRQPDHPHEKRVIPDALSYALFSIDDGDYIYCLQRFQIFLFT